MPPSSKKKCCCDRRSSCSHFFGTPSPGAWCELPGETLYYTRTRFLPVTGGPWPLHFGENETWRGWYGLIPITTTFAGVWNCEGAFRPGTYNVMLRLTCRTVGGISGIEFEQVILGSDPSSNVRVSKGQLSLPETGPPTLVRTCPTDPGVIWAIPCTNIELFGCDALNIRCVLPTLPYNGQPYSLLDGRITL